MRNTALGNTLSNSLGPARLSLLAFLAVGSLSPSTASSQPARIERIFDIAIAGDAVVAGDQLYFIGNDGGGPELWVTDGTSVRTKMVRDIWQLGLVTPGRGPGSFPGPYWLTTAGDRVMTDGSIAGTVEFEEPAISAFGLSPLGCLGNALILASRDALFKLEIPIRR